MMTLGFYIKKEVLINGWAKQKLCSSTFTRWVSVPSLESGGVRRFRVEDASFGFVGVVPVILDAWNLAFRALRCTVRQEAGSVHCQP